MEDVETRYRDNEHPMKQVGSPEFGPGLVERKGKGTLNDAIMHTGVGAMKELTQRESPDRKDELLLQSGRLSN